MNDNVQTTIKIPQGRYTLKRINDSAGDTGICVEAVGINPETNKLEIIPNMMCIGYGLRVGSNYARTYTELDWWMTTPITEFISTQITDHHFFVHFKTRNSEYHFYDD